MLLLLLRELSEGTSEEASESDSSSLVSSSESLSRLAAENCADSVSMVGFLKFSFKICDVAFGFPGFGLWIFDGDSERPFATFDVLTRREFCLADLPDVLSSVFVAFGMSRTFSLRPVVGSVTDSLAGSWETW